MKKILIVVVLLLAGGTAHAGVLLIAAHPAVPPHNVAIGGETEQMLAQTFTPVSTTPPFPAGFTGGRLDRIELAIRCNPESTGLVTIELQEVGTDGLPNGVVLGSVSATPADLDAVVSAPSFPIVEFRFPGVRIDVGVSRAIVMRGDETVDCGSAGLGGPTGGHAGGEAFFDATPASPKWEPLAPGSATNDLPFWVYLVVPEPTPPRFCEIFDGAGLPNDWIPEHVPICACLMDPVLSRNRCWFAFPDWLLWREMPLPWENPAGRAEWRVLPLNQDFPGVRLQEFGPKGEFFGEELEFDSGLRPFRTRKAKVPYEGVFESTLIKMEFEGPDGPAGVIFETQLGDPDQQQ